MVPVVNSDLPAIANDIHWPMGNSPKRHFAGSVPRAVLIVGVTTATRSTANSRDAAVARRFLLRTRNLRGTAGNAGTVVRNPRNPATILMSGIVERRRYIADPAVPIPWMNEAATPIGNQKDSHELSTSADRRVVHTQSQAPPVSLCLTEVQSREDLDGAPKAGLQRKRSVLCDALSTDQKGNHALYQEV